MATGRDGGRIDRRNCGVNGTRRIQPKGQLGLGVYLHGLAGDIAAERFGRHGLIASDVLKAVSGGNSFADTIVSWKQGEVRKPRQRWRTYQIQILFKGR